MGKIEKEIGAIPDVHELITADFLAGLGYDLIFIAPKRIPGERTPDIAMDGGLWEMKSPKGRGSRVIEDNLRNALRQSSNVVLDLRRMDGRIPTAKLLNEVERQFSLARSLKRIIVITRQNTHVDFKR